MREILGEILGVLPHVAARENAIKKHEENNFAEVFKNLAKYRPENDYIGLNNVLDSLKLIAKY